MEKVIYIIPTPIGNLEDITLRAIRFLKESDLVLAEDTRVTKKLFLHYDVITKMESYHSYNEHRKIDSIIEKILQGVKVSLVSDAGSPSISDPGYLLVRACIQANINVQCLPGATAFVPALVQSGLPCERFIFEGFLPVRKGRQKRIVEIVNNNKTTIIYESPHKILKTLSDFKVLCPDRKVVVLKELTKMYENSFRGTIVEVYESVQKAVIKGEFVIVLSASK